MSEEQEELTIYSYKEVDIFPFCIVWCPIPVISWVFPFLGHVGIATSEGIIRDFACSGHVCENSFAYGAPVKYWQVTNHDTDDWNNAIEAAVSTFDERKHGVCRDNSYSFVCAALNEMKFLGKENWRVHSLLPVIWFKLRYVDNMKMLNRWIPVMVLYGFMGIIAFMLYDAAVHSQDGLNN